MDGSGCVYAVFVRYLHPGGDTLSYLRGGLVTEDQVRLEEIHFLIQIDRGGDTHVEVPTMPSERVGDRFAVQDRRYGDKYAQRFADLYNNVAGYGVGPARRGLRYTKHESVRPRSP